MPRPAQNAPKSLVCGLAQFSVPTGAHAADSDVQAGRVPTLDRPEFDHIQDGRDLDPFSEVGSSRNAPRNRQVVLAIRDGFRDDLFVDGTTAYSNAVRIGYARVSGRTQDHQLQLDALAGAGCREVVVETASTRGERPKLRATLNTLKAGDTLVIYKPDRVARSMKELLVLLEDDLHAKDINLHILTGICAGLHRPNAASIADKMLFMVASMAAPPAETGFDAYNVQP
jgi:hypothetical protein